MPARHPRLPFLGRLLVALRRLGGDRVLVEADFLELFHARAAAHGLRHARRRYLADALSLWTHPKPMAAQVSSAPARGARGMLMQNLTHDARYALRMMARAPGFTAVAVLSLAIGIGATTTLFSVTDAVLLRELSVEQPDELVLFGWQAPREFRVPGLRGTFVRDGYPAGMWGSSTFHHRMYREFESRHGAQGSPLESLFAFAAVPVTAVARGEAESLSGQVVTGSYAAGLGVRAAIGRTIDPSDDRAGAAPVAVISHRYWQERFAGDPAAIGETIVVNRVPVSIAGVFPADFRGPWQVGREPDITLPLSLATQLEPNSPLAEKPGRLTPYWLLVMGRLAGNATPAQVQSYFEPGFQTIALELMPPPRRDTEPATLATSQYPQLAMRPGNRGLWEVRSIYSPKIALLFGAAGLVLLIACANVANLLLSRASARGPELTVRLAMGAGRGRVMRQLLTESVMLALCGGALGVVLSIWGIRALAAFSEAGGLLPQMHEYGISWRVLAFSAACSMLTGMLFGVVPALRASRRDLTGALKEAGRSGVQGGRGWFARGLIVAQVAVSLVLLAGAGLFVRTLTNLQRVDTGFDQRNLLVFGLSPSTAGYEGPRQQELYRALAGRFEALPGVTSVTFAQMPLVAHYMYGRTVQLPGEPAGAAADHGINYLMVRENYHAAMRIPILRGRPFDSRDTAGGLKVALVNETFATKYLAGRDPIGLRVSIDGEADETVEIIGITRDIVYNNQREDKEALVFVPWQQAGPMFEASFAVRTAGDPLALAPLVRQSVRAEAPNLPVDELSTQEALAGDTLAEERQYATLIGLASMLALGLAAVGLYGVIAYWVAQRTREIGIRMALGARRAGVLGLVVRQALGLVIAGVAAGLVLAFYLTGLIQERLYHVQAADPVTFTLVTLALVATGLAACVVPARRASKLDPMIAVRSD